MLEKHFSQRVGLLNLYTSLHFLCVLVFSIYTSIVVFFADVSADVSACVCTRTAVSAVAYTQPRCSNSFAMCMCYCKMYLMSKETNQQKTHK